MPGNTGRDFGYTGQLVALSGIKGKQGFGLRIDQSLLSLTAGYMDDCYPANSNRVWLLMQNAGGADVYYGFGQTPDAAISQKLEPGDSFLINEDLPWCGSLSFGSTAAILIKVLEASLAGV